MRRHAGEGEQLTTSAPVLNQARGRLTSSVARAHASLQLIFTVLVAMPVLAADDISGADLAARAAVVLVFLTLATWMVWAGERRVQLVLLLAVWSACSWQVLGHHLPGETTVGVMITASVLLGARVLPPVPAALNAVGTWALFGVAAVVVGPESRESLKLEDYALATAMGLAAVGFVNALELLAGRAGAAERFAGERRRSLLRRAAENEAVTHARRVLHDDVLGTLQIIMSGTATDRDAVRASCAATVREIDEVLGTSSVREVAQEPSEPGASVRTPSAPLIDRVASGLPLTVDVHCSRAAAAALDRLGRRQAEALERAAREALRNVVRHAGRSRATLGVEADRDGVRLIVEDDGRGMPAGASPGFGIEHSMQEAMGAVGGEVSIDSEPGAGTTVTLRLPRHPRPSTLLQRTFAETTAGVGILRLAVLSLALPMLGVWVLISLTQSLAEHDPVRSLALAAAWTGLSVLTMWRVGQRALTPTWAISLYVAVSVLQAAGLAMLEDGALLDYRSWSVGFSAIPLVLLGFVLPAPLGLIVIFTQPVLVAAAVWLDPALGDGALPFGSLNAPVTAPVTALILGVLVRRANRRAIARTRQANAVEHALLLEEARATSAGSYFRYSRDVVRPWLVAVSRDEVDPLDPRARDGARLIAAGARDDLYAPGFLDDELRRAVAAYREAGGTVDLRAGLTAGLSDAPVRRLLARLLRMAPEHRIIVTPSGEGGRVRLSVVPPPSAAALAELLDAPGVGFTADVDSFRAVFVVADTPVSG